jgi:cytochrome c-type biogenesis protein CcmE
MNHKAIKLGLTVVVLATAFGALLFVSLGENLQYYKYVDEVMADPHAWIGKPLRVHGYVVPNSINRKQTVREYRFDVQHNGKMIRAYFTGTPPDAFKDEAEVVLTGVLNKDAFMATDIQAKCPSKYEERAGKSPGIVAWLGNFAGR